MSFYFVVLASCKTFYQNTMKKVRIISLALVLMFCCSMPAISGLKSKIVGTWQLCNKFTQQVDTSYGETSQMRYKMITPTNFMVLEVKYDLKVLYGAFLGSYTLEKDVYTEFIDYAGSGYGLYLGQGNRFKIKIKGDLMFIKGINNPYEEVWKKVAKK
jgi:hypothetical protein